MLAASSFLPGVPSPALAYMHAVCGSLFSSLESCCGKQRSLNGYNKTILLILDLFACLMSRTISAKKQCFSPTINQRTVLPVMAFQRSEKKKTWEKEYLDYNMHACLLGMNIFSDPFTYKFPMIDDGRAVRSPHSITGSVKEDDAFG
jgi:hypothetical protein